MSAPRGLVLSALLCLACGATAGCALLTKQDPLSPRYFSPELGGVVTGEESAAAGAGRGLALRLGRVGSAASLKERIMHRDSAHEVGFYEERRWTERPEVYLRRELSRSLFEEKGLSRVVSGDGQTLEVELSELEEVRGAVPVARARVTYALHDDHVVRRSRTFVIDRPIAAGADGEAIAAALGAAMRAAIDRISTDVVRDLQATPVAMPGCAPPPATK